MVTTYDEYDECRNEFVFNRSGWERGFKLIALCTEVDQKPLQLWTNENTGVALEGRRLDTPNAHRQAWISGAYQ